MGKHIADRPSDSPVTFAMRESPRLFYYPYDMRSHDVW